MTKGYLYKLIRSPLTYIGVLGVFAVCLANMRGLLINEHTTVMSRIDLFLDLDAFRKLTVIFAAVPFTANFADEWKNNVTTFCVSRRGIKKYAASNVLLCAVTSFLAVFLGIMLYMLVMSVFTEFDRQDLNIHSGFPYCEFLNNGPRWLYPVIRIFVFSVSASMWCVMGLMLSAFIPNKYVAVCSPVVASYVVERITIQLPVQMNLHSLSLSVPLIYNSFTTFIYTMLVFTGISAVCGFVFYYVLRKRVQNEFN